MHGEPRRFFNDDELCHMNDVRVLFEQGILYRNIATGVFGVTLAVLAVLGFKDRGKLDKKHTVGVLLRCYQYMSLGFLATIAVLGGLIALNFDRAFVIFHEIFFVDNWQFSPAESNMINMLPQEFFISITAVIMGLYMGMTLLLAGLSFSWRKRMKV